MDALVTAMESGLADTAKQILESMGTLVPTLLPVFGGFAVIGLAMKVFRKVVG